MSTTGGAPGSCVAGPVVPQRLWRLSNIQYGNAVMDLLGLTSPPVVSAGGTSTHAFFTPDSEQVTSQLAFEYDSAGAGAMAGIGSRRAAVVGCAAGATEDVCARDFIARFCARAFRRPLGAEDTADLLAVFAEGRRDGFDAGIDLVIEAVLQAPSFLYRRDIGARAGAGTARLSPYEIASQLSFLFLDSLPDPGLWAAAENGRLATDAGVAAEVDRLLADGRVRQNLTRVMLAWLATSRVLDAEKDSKLYPQFTPALRASLYKETELFVQDLLWSGSARLGDLFTSSHSFADAAVASIYRIAAPGGAGGGFKPVDLPQGQRAGVLTQASFLAARAGVARTSVVYRGIFVHNEVLSLPHVPLPPASLQSDVAAATKSNASEKEKAAARAARMECSVCHAQFDPVGLAFENYDAIGGYRTSVSGVPVDASVDLNLAPSLSGHVDGAIDLARKIAVSPALRESAARHYLGYAIGRDDVDQQSCALGSVRDALASNDGNLVDLFRAVGVSPALKIRRMEGAP